MSQSEDQKDRAYRRELDSAYHQLSAAQDDVAMERIHNENGPSVDAIGNLEAAIVSMRRKLLPLIQKKELKEMWKYYRIEEIPSKCAQKRLIEGEYGHFGIKGDDDVETHHASMADLQVWCEGLERIYSKLGFAPDVDDVEQQTKIDGDLLKEVHEWRQENTE